jgi:hypothetical protein
MIKELEKNKVYLSSLNTKSKNFVNKDLAFFNSAKAKLFKMIDEGVKSKNNFVADSAFWKEFKKI